MVDNSSTAEYTGLAAGTVDGQHYIYAANDAPGGGIDVYNDSFQRVTFLPGSIFHRLLRSHFSPRGLRPMASMTLRTC